MPRYGKLLTLGVVTEAGPANCGHALERGDLAMAHLSDRAICLPCGVTAVTDAMRDRGPSAGISKARLAEISLALRGLLMTQRPTAPARTEEAL